MTSTPPTVGPLVRLTSANPTRYFDAASMTVLRGATLSVAVVLSPGRTTTRTKSASTTTVSSAPSRERNDHGLLPDRRTAGPRLRQPQLSRLLFRLHGFTVGDHADDPLRRVPQFHEQPRLRRRPGLLGQRRRGRRQQSRVADLGRHPRHAGRGRAERRPVGAVADDGAKYVPVHAPGQTFGSSRPARSVRSPTCSCATSSRPSGTRSTSDWSTPAATRWRSSGRTTRSTRTSRAWRWCTIPRSACRSAGRAERAAPAGRAASVERAEPAASAEPAARPTPAPDARSSTVPAYGYTFVHDTGRNLLYVSSGVQAAVHPSTIVTVDPSAAAVTSFVPVGNDPQPLALSDDGSALWVGLAGERRVRRMTPGTTPVPGPAYTLPKLLTTGEAWCRCDRRSPRHAGVDRRRRTGPNYGGQGVFILDDGQPRANYVQPPEVPSSFLINGPPGYLLGIGAARTWSSTGSALSGRRWSPTAAWSPATRPGSCTAPASRMRARARWSS